MTINPIMLFLAFGAVFGAATAWHRHLFSEGTTVKREGDAKSDLLGKLAWVVMCTCLWPLMAVSGVYTLIRRWWIARR